MMWGCILLFIIGAELAFRLWHHRKFGRAYHVALQFPWEENYITAHPFLTFSYKRNAKITQNQSIPYPLHPHKFFSYYEKNKLNNYGHLGEDFLENKDPNTLRIICLGDSTTCNNVGDGYADHSYPDMLAAQLNDKLDKGVTVAVERRVRHATYGKIQRRTTTFMVHDENNSAKVGDRIAMVETRPFSHRKRFVVTRIIERAESL